MCYGSRPPMRMARTRVTETFLIVMAAELCSCDGQQTSPMDAGPLDGAAEAGLDAHAPDTGSDAGTEGGADGAPADSASGDAAMDGPSDAALDAAGDAIDAAGDAASDVGVDGAQDAQTDAHLDNEKLVFVTSTLHQANFGSLEDADAICQARAVAADLPGTFRAWLSTRDVTAADRLTHAAVPYVRTDGTRIADGWDDLVDGTLAASISIDEMGTARTGDVWTGTMLDGSNFTPCSRDTCDCQLWTDNTTSWVSQCGRSTETNWQWSEQQQVVCSVALRLYCFQQ
jgi:hypothetical protein